MDYIPLQKKHTQEVASLHINGISTGFISSLGGEFVTALYEAIAQSQSSFGVVAEEENRMLGFVAFTTDINKLYKSVVLTKGLRFAFLLAGKMFSPKRLKEMFETLFYPYRIRKMNLPYAELLSIVVAPEASGKGIGTQLLQKGLQGCARIGVERVKVLVGTNNEAANRLYEKCGFALVGQINNHGIISNIYVASTGKKGNDGKTT